MLQNNVQNVNTYLKNKEYLFEIFVRVCYNKYKIKGGMTNV